MIPGQTAVATLAVNEMTGSIMPPDPEPLRLTAERVLNNELDRVRLASWSQDRASLAEWKREF